MNVDTIYPELRRHLDTYEHDEVAARLPELMAYGEAVVVTHPRRPPMVLTPAWRWDDLVAAMAALNNLIEQRRQAAEPLPRL